jgi:hypothetical protein
VIKTTKFADGGLVSPSSDVVDKSLTKKALQAQKGK